MNNSDMHITEHLDELRWRIIKILIPLIIVTLVIYYYIPLVFQILTKPLSLNGSSLVFIAVTDAFIIRMKASIIISIIVLSPLILYQGLKFISPGLTKREKYFFYKLLFTSLFLFSTGALISYFFIVPKFLSFLITYGREYLEPTLLADKFIGFIIVIIIITGVIFLLPLGVYLLIKMDLITSSTLKASRKYVIIVIIFFEGLVLPSFDIFIFLIFLIPLLVAYELIIIIQKHVEKKNKHKL